MRFCAVIQIWFCVVLLGACDEHHYLDIGVDLAADLSADLQPVDQAREDPAADIAPDLLQKTGWVVTAGTAGVAATVEGQGLVVDSSGRTSLAGSYMGKATFGAGAALPFAGGKDMLVARVNALGAVQKVLPFGGTGAEAANDLALDGAGNLYVTGSHEGQWKMGSFSLTTNGGVDLFVARVDPAGKVSWVVSGGGPQYDIPYSIAADSAGNCYVAGAYKHMITVGGVTIKAKGASDAFVLRLGPTGNVIWARTLGGSADDVADEVAVDSSGYVHVTGYFTGAAAFGTHALTASGKADVFVARLDPAGQVQRVTRAGGASTWAHGTGLAVDSSGRVMITGTHDGPITLGTQKLSGSGLGVFVAGLDKSGIFKWANHVASSKYLYGHTPRPRIVMDGAGNGHLSSGFTGTFTLGGKTIKTSGTVDTLVARITPAGKITSVVTAGGTEATVPYDLAVDSAGNVLVTGGFTQSATFGADKVSVKGYMDLFLWRIPAKMFP